MSTVECLYKQFFHNRDSVEHTPEEWQSLSSGEEGCLYTKSSQRFGKARLLVSSPGDTYAPHVGMRGYRCLHSESLAKRCQCQLPVDQ